MRYSVATIALAAGWQQNPDPGVRHLRPLQPVLPQRHRPARAPRLIRAAPYATRPAVRAAVAVPSTRSAASSPPWMQSGCRRRDRRCRPAPGAARFSTPRLDPRDQLLVAHVVLRHRAAANGRCSRRPARRGSPSSRSSSLEHQRQQLLVVHLGQFRPAGPADEDPQQHLPLRRAMRILPAAETARQDRALLDRRDHDAHAVQRMADLLAGR